MDDLKRRLYEGKQDFTERELRTLIEYEHDTIIGENRRWTCSVETIIKVEDKYFSICWEQGLTENQPDEFDNQPVEVIPVTKTVQVTTYELINK